VVDIKPVLEQQQSAATILPSEQGLGHAAQLLPGKQDAARQPEQS